MWISSWVNTIRTYLISDFARIQVHVKVLKKFEVIFSKQGVSKQWTKHLREKAHFRLESSKSRLLHARQGMCMHKAGAESVCLSVHPYVCLSVCMSVHFSYHTGGSVTFSADLWFICSLHKKKNWVNPHSINCNGFTWKDSPLLNGNQTVNEPMINIAWHVNMK